MSGVNLDVKSLLLGLIIFAGLLYFINPSIFSSFHQTLLTTTSQSTETPTSTATQTTPTQTANQALPQYQVGTVKLKYMNYFSRAGVVSTVEALQVPSQYTFADLEKIAQNPNRVPLATVTTDSNGYATFSDIITAGVPTLYAFRNGTTYYESLDVLTVPVPTKQFAISSYQFPGAIYIYPIGSFTSPGTNQDASTSTLLNVTATTSGIQYLEVTMTIGESDAGEALKNPVLVIRTPDTATQLASGMIKSLYIVHDSGTDFGVPVTDLKSYINGPAIPLRGSLSDKMGNTYMTVADSGTYKIKLTWDASLAKAGNEIDFVLDDLGAYRGTTIASLQNGASPATLSVTWGS